MSEYIDLAFFSSYTRTTYDNTTTPTDTEVQAFIDLSEQEINENTGRTWGTKTITDEIHDSPGPEIYLKNYPVISVTEVRDKELNVLVEGIDNDYSINGSYITLNNIYNRVYVDYTSGYTLVRADAKMLTTLLTINKVRQSQSSNASNSKKIQVGPITIEKGLGTQTVLNIDSDITKYEKRLRRLIR